LPFVFLSSSLHSLSPLPGITLLARDLALFRGGDAAAPDPAPRPRDLVLCAYSLLGEAAEVTVIEDAATDPRSAHCPLVLGPTGLRFYAGAPLIGSRGDRLGSLCVSGTSPRALAPGEARLLANFAELAVRQLERDAAGGAAGLGSPLASPAGSGASLPPLLAPPPRPIVRPPDAASRAAMIVDTAGPGWPVLCANRAWSFLTGADSAGGGAGWEGGGGGGGGEPPPSPPPPSLAGGSHPHPHPHPHAPPSTSAAGRRFFDLYRPVGHASPSAAAAALAAHAACPASAGTDFVLDVVPRVRRPSGMTRGGDGGGCAGPPPPPLRVQLRPCFARALDDDSPAVLVPAEAGEGGGGGLPAPSALLPLYFGHLSACPVSGGVAGQPLPQLVAAAKPTETVPHPPPVPSLVPKIATDDADNREPAPAQLRVCGACVIS